MFFKVNINKKTKVLLLTIFVLNITALALFTFIFYIVLGKYKAVAKLDVDVKVTKNRQDEIVSTKHLILDTKEDIDKLNSYFVDSDSIVGFIRDIETLGSKSGVSLTVSSVDISSKNGSSLSLKFTTKGDWSNSMYLLALLESMPVRMDINKVAFIKRDGVDDEKAYWGGEFIITLLSFLDNK